MIKGRVVSRFWASKKLDVFPHGALLEVEMDDKSKIIAYDPLGCGDGEQVLITQGSVAAGYFKECKVPVDALIVGSLDESH